MQAAGFNSVSEAIVAKGWQAQFFMGELKHKDVMRASEDRSVKFERSHDGEISEGQLELERARDSRMTPEQLLIQRDAVSKAFRRMSRREREYVRLAFWDGLTYDAIGKRVGISRERVRQVVTNGIAAAAGRPRPFLYKTVVARGVTTHRGCHYCGESFEVGINNVKKLYCSRCCREKARRRADRSMPKGKKEA